MLRQYDSAIKELLLRKDARPAEAWPHFFLAEAYLQKGMEKEWVSELKEGLRQQKSEQALREVQRAYLKGGSEGIKAWFLDNDLARQRKAYVSPRELARDYGMLRQKEQTLATLEAAFRERTPQLIFIQYTPEFDFIHDDPRYRKIVKDMNMDPAY
jgi:hypothetical protein